ncbi:MAG: type II toxin-antitoxin system RelE/ParE family toxin [Candidatus Acidulodesulfobacterium ferriphilum]|uniref:Type II toxin-antitoxin system RelE/ParE family toxin n=1 Tax=Candidatus Acidulodesulfobacterium ferriphilum TaxID=2597223 RepID=A0A519BCC1_9DELT|nr:MAG: type II toxin-antitoxin system RelE/ParE family toxin [Candidatus Acidulodesulfobacterium ferriphilum]
MFTLRYYPAVKKDIKELDNRHRDKIKKAIEEKLQVSPQSSGIPLKGDLSNCYKLRVGDYRVIYEIQENEVTILCIKHRKDVYKTAVKRI